MCIRDRDYILLTKYAMNNMSNISVCILLGLYTGLRIGEVCALPVSYTHLDVYKRQSFTNIFIIT